MNKFSTIADVCGQKSPLSKVAKPPQTQLPCGFSDFLAILSRSLDKAPKSWKTFCSIFLSAMFHVKQKTARGGFYVLSCLLLRFLFYHCWSWDLKSRRILAQNYSLSFIASTQELDGIRIVSSVKSSLSTILLLISTPDSFTASINLSIEE